MLLQHRVFHLLVCFTFLSLTECQGIGESCTFDDGTSGTCELLAKCIKAQEGIKQGKLPKRCGFQGLQPIVCCLSAAPIVPIATGPGAKSQQKCLEYAKAVYQMVEVPTNLPINVAKNVSECGIVSTPLVVGGEETKPKEFPHMVAIGFGRQGSISWECGGSLISENFVLTAAHCLHSRQKGPAAWARLGDINLQKPDDDANVQEAAVLQSFKHPDYQPPPRYNDIALLKLDQKFTFTGSVRPACLHIRDEYPITKAIATGWGRIGYSSNPSDVLLKVELHTVSTDDCNKTYKADQSTSRLRHGIVETMLCAGEKEGGKDTCQGDSGGPLQYVLRKPYCMYSIVGVTSFGKFCGFKNSPAVYTKVAHFIPWIESVVWP